MNDYHNRNSNSITNLNGNYINNISENNNLYHKDNFTNNNYYSNSMIEPKTNKNILNIQNYQLLSSYPNNLNYQYKNNTPFNTQNYEQNSNQNINEKNLLQNILISPNEKNISLTSQISQEIDRQKIKFDEMVEKAKNINNSEIFEFDIKKYLPKDNFENSKTFRKYKDLIKPNVINSNRNNFFSKKNAEFKYNEIKDNSLSEIPFRNDNLFEEELSNFNLENKDINVIDYNNNEKGENYLELKKQEQLKQNLIINLDNNINNNFENNNIDELEEINKKDKLNKVKNSNQDNLDKNIECKMDDESNIIKPYFLIYHEQIDIDKKDDDNKTEENEYDDEIERLNNKLINENNKMKHFNDFIWYCMDFKENKPENIFNDFFNNNII